MLKYTIVIMFIIVSCKTTNNNVKEEITVQKQNEKKGRILLLDTVKQYSLPFGDKLVLTKFPDRWEFPSIYEEENRKKEKFEIILDSLNSSLDSFMYETSLKINKQKDSSNYILTPVNKYFNYYEDYTFYNLRWKVKEVITIPIGKIKNFIKNIDIVILQDVTNSNFQNIVTINSTNQIIDGINIGYSENIYEFSHSAKYYFIDKNRIIHLKHFISMETEIMLQGYEKYQILPSGKIVRYFDKEKGDYTNKQEKGYIQAHTKDSVWTEIKPNVYTGDYTYVNGNYKMGKPIGIWRYYNLLDKTKKGDKLLMTEEYDTNGKLLKREILRE